MRRSVAVMVGVRGDVGVGLAWGEGVHLWNMACMTPSRASSRGKSALGCAAPPLLNLLGRTFGRARLGHPSYASVSVRILAAR